MEAYRRASKPPPAAPFRAAILYASLVAGVLLSLPAHAQAPCAPYPAVARELERQHGEVPIWRGAMLNGPVLELLQSPDKRSWTVLIVLPSGLACFAAAGEGGSLVPLGRPGKGA